MSDQHEAPRLFDSHCHLDMKNFRGRLDSVYAAAAAAGVRKLLLASYDEKSSYESLNILKEGNRQGIELWAAAGVHPHEADTVRDGLPEELTDLGYNDAVVAVGEIGLDYYYDNSPREIQAQVFVRQIGWAREVGKPVLVHLRNAENRKAGDAYGQAMDILKDQGASDVGGIIHCFSGNIDDARRALDLGFHLSFAGPLTYPKATELREVAAFAPIDRIFAETDSPYLAPQSRRGKQNEPALVREVYEKLADVRKTPLNDLAESLWLNSEKLFKR